MLRPALTAEDLATLDRLLRRRPAWHSRAACRGVGPDVFYPSTRGEHPSPEALELCGRCPVRAECVEAGRRERHGVWAGTGPYARKRAQGEARAVG